MSYIMWRLRAPQKIQVKAQPAVNGRPLNNRLERRIESFVGLPAGATRRHHLLRCASWKGHAIPGETRLAANAFSSRLIVT